MTTIRVTLVFDPFGVWPEPGERVRDLRDELKAFKQIEALLRRDERFETVTPKSYLVDAECWQHFQSYRGVAGVAFQEVTPRQQLAERLGEYPPEWLTDQQILELRLLELGTSGEAIENWPATIARWVTPGVVAAASLSDWLYQAAEAKTLCGLADSGPLIQWFRDSFAHAAQQDGVPNDMVKQIAADLDHRHDPRSFAARWLCRRALLPLADVSARNPLRAPGLDYGSPQQRALARYIPLVFPLPQPLHAEICQKMRQAVHNARIQNHEAFEQVVLKLEALWEGLAEELKVWLAMHPRAMTQAAADHLRRLPGFEQDDLARRLVNDYAPPQRVPVWPGLDEGPAFDDWIAAYARFLQSSFIRRDLPQEPDDPADGFGRWLKDHDTVSFAHPERSYSVVARRVQSSLANGRSVILVLMDALAIHMVYGLADYMADRLRCEPSWWSNLFAPVPTITAVCKEAVLTGATPDRTCGNLRQALLRAYRLGPSELQISASWEDAERTALQPTTRLLVHRDNRLDDRLHETGSYCSLVEDCVGIFARTAALLARWVEDFRCINQSSPVVLLTADHGFTYGPPPGYQVGASGKVAASRRCVEIDGDPAAMVAKDPSLTALDGARFHLARSYLAARGRRFGTDTATGWTLAHGGLLPEEVVIPVLEWFGDEAAVCWPSVVFPDGAWYDRRWWVVPLAISNPHSRRLNAGTVTIGVSGSGLHQQQSFPALDAGGSHRIEFRLPADNLPDGEKLCVDVTLKIRAAGGQADSQQTQQYLVERAKRLVERTEEQDAFESMF
jgi:hypothetical protein